MGLYNKYVLPRIIDWTCSQKPNLLQRQKVVPLAQGRVLEIGVGSGLNIPVYNKEQVQHLTAVEPSLEIWNQRTVDIGQLGFGFEFLKAKAEQLPMENQSFDSVVITYTLCSIEDTAQSLSEIRRVLKINGRLIFCEHGKAPDKNVARWQNIINPLWKRFGGGCNLNRDIPAIIQENGFRINDLQTMYIPGWKPGSFNYWGTADIY